MDHVMCSVLCLIGESALPTLPGVGCRNSCMRVMILGLCVCLFVSFLSVTTFSAGTPNRT